MTQLDRQLSAELLCSELAAREFIKHGQVVAGCFRELRNRYDIDLILDTKRKLARKASADGGTGAKAVSAITNMLPVAAKRFWAAFKKTKQAQEQFQTALSAFEYILPNGGVPLTFVLEALHDQQMLAEPEAVAEGRLVYEALQRDFRLLEDLGL